MVTTTCVPGRRWILKGLKELITWACMSFKPLKSRFLVLKKGKTSHKFCFTLGSVHPIIEKLVKSHGKVLNCNLRDTSSI